MMDKRDAQQLHEYIGAALLAPSDDEQRETLEAAREIAADLVGETDYEIRSTRIGAMREALFLIYSAPDNARANRAADMLIRIASDGIAKGDWHVELGVEA